MKKDITRVQVSGYTEKLMLVFETTEVSALSALIEEAHREYINNGSANDASNSLFELLMNMFEEGSAAVTIKRMLKDLKLTQA